MKAFTNPYRLVVRICFVVSLLILAENNFALGQCQWTEPFPLEWNEFDSGETKKVNCRNGLWASQYPLRMAVSDQELILLDQTRECDKERVGFEFCQKMNSRKLKSQENVLVGVSSGNLSCVQDSRGRAGWVPTDNLSMLKTPTPSEDNWIGNWVAGSDSLTISLEQEDQLRVRGLGFWKGNGDNYNTGRFDYTGQANSCTMNLGENQSHDCRVVLRLLGDSLVVAENGKCGGANVRFNDVYRRI